MNVLKKFLQVDSYYYYYSISAALLGVATGLWIPRGPFSKSDALLSVFFFLIAGLVIGLFRKLRWSLFISIAVFWITYEITRIGYVGPTVDMPRIGSLYSIIALISGRLFTVSLTILPLLIGSSIGKVINNNRSLEGKTSEKIRQLVTNLIKKPLLLLGILIIILFTIQLSSLATTPQIEDDSGKPIEGSIAEIAKIEIGGKEQTLLIRGQNKENPVILYLAGGPGGTDIGAMRMFGSKLEEEFVVVTWDQRGSGKSYSAIDPTENLTLDQLLDDTLEVTNYLRDRFDREKIYLVGNSWGTTLGTLAVYEKPELYTAYIGTGQMVSQKETDIMFYEDTLKYARDNDNSALEDDLIANRKPPYQDIYKYEIALSHEREWNEFPHFTGESEMSSTLTASEYTLVDTINGFGAFLDSFSVLYPQLQDIDFRKDIVKLEVPVYMVVGKYEARGRAVLADEWFENLEAPSKKRVVFEESAHRPHFEQPEEFIELMIEVKQVTKK